MTRKGHENEQQPTRKRRARSSGEQAPPGAEPAPPDAEPVPADPTAGAAASASGGAEAGGGNKEASAGATSAEAPAAASTHPQNGTPAPVIVGIGSSAGGMEALLRLLPTLPQKELTFVVVQHLAADQSERFLHSLQEQLHRPVAMVQAGVVPAEGVVYLAPAHALVEINEGAFQIVRRPEPPRPLLPIDYFLHSLAHGPDGPGIGILLSGMGSDGIAGLREIRAAGGIVVAQHPASAEYETLPRAAIEAGLADLILTPEEIGPELPRLVARLPLRSRQARVLGEDIPIDDPGLQRVFELLRRQAGVDFSTYKPGTIRRRLQRRMVLNRLDTLSRYVRLLEENPVELKDLYQDLLIHVTRFFRDPGSFEVLQEKVFPRLLDGRRQDDPIRIWVPGCSTGEEAYSMAMSLLEFLGERASSYSVQIFATDLSDSAVAVARAGLYPQSAAEQLSPERLKRFFSPADGGFRIAKAVRDFCVFTRHDLTRDPPFSHLDLIMCRNVLIYLGASLQARVMAILHYGLKPGGFLVLGSAESVGARADLFRVVEKRHSLYEKKGGAATQHIAFGAEPGPGTVGPGRRIAATGTPDVASSLADRHLLEHYAPPAVIVDASFNILQTRGQTGHFLELAPGEANLNVLRMVREGLLYGLRTALHQARQGSQPVRKEGLTIRVNGGEYRVSLEVVPLGNGDGRHFLVLFEESAVEEQATPHPLGEPLPEGAEASARIGELQEELAGTRNYLQSMIQDLEAANEELQSANEEILSSNEELQSTNEELDTAREELQSTNEELHTLNEELHVRNDELAGANSDLTNLLSSMQIAVVMVDSELRIRRFTPMAEKTLNVLPGDLGRPISHLRPNIDCPDLEVLLRTAVEQTESIEREVRAKGFPGRVLLRIRPYKGAGGRIEGAMLTLIDIEELRTREREIVEARQFAAELLAMIPHPLALLGPDLRVRSLNEPFARRLGLSASGAIGRSLDDMVGDGALSAVTEKRRRSRRHREIKLPLSDGATLHGHFLDAAGVEDGLMLVSVEEGGEGDAAG